MENVAILHNLRSGALLVMNPVTQGGTRLNSFNLKIRSHTINRRRCSETLSRRNAHVSHKSVKKHHSHAFLEMLTFVCGRLPSLLKSVLYVSDTM